MTSVSDNAPTTNRPNVIIFLADDLGYADVGCYGGEIDTPAIDGLAERGQRLTRFYTTARCSPSRASLLTGLHPHQTGIGILTQDDGPVGYPGTINQNCATLAELLHQADYQTHMSGKWHLAKDRSQPNDGWPTRRGFDQFFGTLTGCGSFFDPGTLTRGETPADDAQDPDFYYTDAIGDDASDFIRHADPNRPFFLYVAFSAPHWPLHAKEQDVAKYRGRFDQGYDALRLQRYERQQQLGVIEQSDVLSDRDPEVPAWDALEEKAWQASRMEAYAAQVDSMDQNIAKVLDALNANGVRENTFVMFLSDNGASHEELPLGKESDAAAFRQRRDIFPGTTRDGRPIALGNRPEIAPGPEDTYASYGRGWANLSNTPFRLYKEWIHEGGVASPTVISWPAGGVKPGVSDLPLQLVDVVPTVLEAAGVDYPERLEDRDLIPAQGESFLGLLRGQHRGSRPLYWEHIGNAGIRIDDWKLVRAYPHEWELYDTKTDPTELRNVAAQYPDTVAELTEQWEAWARRAGVVPWPDILASYRAQGLSEQVAKGS